MPSSAKQAETTAYDAMRANPFARVHGRPTRADYDRLKSDAGALASEVEDITYEWSKSATDDYGLLADIIGTDEYYVLTDIDTYAIPNEPPSYDPAITDATLTIFFGSMLRTYVPASTIIATSTASRFFLLIFSPSR
jgi:hypothetical protein